MYHMVLTEVRLSYFNFRTAVIRYLFNGNGKRRRTAEKGGKEEKSCLSCVMS